MLERTRFGTLCVMSDPPRTRMQFLRPFTTHVFNRLSRPLAPHLPGFGILEYRGRTSGRTYRTPLNVFRDGQDWILALTYSSRVEWVKNVLAAGECHLITRGRVIPLANPRLFVDPSRRHMPQPIRSFLGIMGVTEFLRLSPAPPRTSAGPAEPAAYSSGSDDRRPPPS
jgi:deazaflavin-dependent oxidoreductase (nitroreductase family)